MQNKVTAFSKLEVETAFSALNLFRLVKIPEQIELTCNINIS